jgi:hypothetical protein
MKIYKQKTFWAGIAGVVTGIGLLVNDNISEGIVAVVGGFQVIFLRQAIK